MKAVFTDDNYKFWIDGARGDMYLFSDDAKADAFAVKHGCFVCKTPNTMEFAHTWAKAAWSFMRCGGTVRVETPEEGSWSAVFLGLHDRVPITYAEFETMLSEIYGLPCVECWACDESTGWKSVNTGLTCEEVYGE